MKPDSNYLFALKAKNVEIAAVDESPEAIRVKTPSASISSNPSPIQNLTLAANYETVMFAFDPVNDIDLDYYEYQLRQSSTSGTLVNEKTSTDGTTQISGTTKANVFTVSVTNSTSSSNIDYYGRVRTVSTSGARSAWSAYDGSGDTPLVASQYIQSLTADKITAGTIGAHTITLGGNTSVIKSSTYDGSWDGTQWTTGSAGWLISGNGQAIFDATQIRGSISAGSINLNTHNYWLPSGSTATFKVGSSSQYLLFDGANLTLSGSLSGASGTFTGTLSGGSVSGGTISIGSSNNIFKADSNGIYLGNATYASAPFRVSMTGSLVATSATITGSISGSTISGSTLTAGTWDSNSANRGLRITSDGYIIGGGSGVKIKNYGTDGTDGETGTILFGDSITSPELGCDQLFISPNGTDEVNIQPSGTTFDIEITTGGIRVASGKTISAVSALYSSGSSTIARLQTTGGDQYLTGGSSSRNLKENIKEIKDGLSIIKLLKPKVFNYKVDAFEKNDPITGEPWTKEAKDLAQLDIKYGLILEEVLETVPELISYIHEKTDIPYYEEGGYADLASWKPQMWEETDVITLCVKAIQELSAKVDELESRLV